MQRSSTFASSETTTPSVSLTKYRVRPTETGSSPYFVARTPRNRNLRQKPRRPRDRQPLLIGRDDVGERRDLRRRERYALSARVAGEKYFALAVVHGHAKAIRCVADHVAIPTVPKAQLALGRVELEGLG